MNDESKSLVDSLKVALENEQMDYGRILNLAAKLSEQDTDNLRFSVDASLINRLGFELVAKQETALAELIKNAYDADATMVELTFFESSGGSGKLAVVDNGSGMTRPQLISGFMRLSTPAKVTTPFSSKFHRQRAGRKGIGRFATQRLGKRLTIQTFPENEQQCYQVVIEWDQFQPHLELFQIANRIEEKAVDWGRLPDLFESWFPRDIISQQKSGTILLIEDLREPWSKAQIERVYRYTFDLIHPLPPETLKENLDPGFESKFFEATHGGRALLIDAVEEILSLAFAKCTCQIDDQGQAQITSEGGLVEISRETIPVLFDEKEKVEWPLLRNVRLEAYYFIPDSDPTPKLYKEKLRNFLKERGGIKLFRNGFRVPPYGQNDNDWLSLDESYGKRETLPPHRNNNFLGGVLVKDIEGKVFQETSSREGVIENETFKELISFAYRSLIILVTRVAEKRGRKVTAQDPTWKPSPKSPKDTASELKKRIKKIISGTGSSDASQKDEDSTSSHSEVGFHEEIDDILEDVGLLGEQAQEILEASALLRILASLGLSIGEFTHEIRLLLSALLSDTEHLGEEGATDVALRLKGNLQLLRSLTAFYDESISAAARKDLEPLDLIDVLNRFKQAIKPRLLREKIIVRDEIAGYDLYTKPMNMAEWDSILINLFTNSLKAIRRKNTNGEIHIKIGSDEKIVFLEFADNGDGIPEQNRERIFNSFFTTTQAPPPAAPEREQFLGMGLGLTIVRDIVQSAGGEITLTTPPAGYTTCFRVEIPSARPEEIPDEFH